MSNSKTASDGEFDLDAVINDADNRPFMFKFKGRSWSMTHLNDLDVWPLMDAADQGDLASMRAVLETALGETWTEFRSHKMPREAMTKLFERYTKHAGLKPGE